MTLNDNSLVWCLKFCFIVISKLLFLWCHVRFYIILFFYFYGTFLRDLAVKIVLEWKTLVGLFVWRHRNNIPWKRTFNTLTILVGDALCFITYTYFGVKNFKLIATHKCVQSLLGLIKAFLKVFPLLSR